MTTDADDAELKAIATILAALNGLDAAARERIISYILTRLDMQLSFPASGSSKMLGLAVGLDREPSIRAETARPSERAKDIRSFAEEKQPKSANEMAALVAYYLQYEAAGDEKKDTISKADIEKYFHLAKFRKPKDAHFTLVNSKNAGYLDQRERGHYGLNPVGYNLIAYKLPRQQKTQR